MRARVCVERRRKKLREGFFPHFLSSHRPSVARLREAASSCFSFSTLVILNFLDLQITLLVRRASRRRAVLSVCVKARYCLTLIFKKANRIHPPNVYSQNPPTETPHTDYEPGPRVNAPSSLPPFRNCYSAAAASAAAMGSSAAFSASCASRSAALSVSN